MDGYDDCSLIDPYNLLGVTINSTPKEVKQAYYNLALLCHPDKGGCSKDMDIVNSAYRYVIEQIESIDFDLTFESLEEDFSKFCLEQEKEKPPTFMEIYDEITGFNKRFNEEFEASTNKIFGTTLPGGYGELMEERDNSTDYNVNVEKDNKNQLKHDFNKEIILYKQPEAANQNETLFDYKKDYGNIEDYSVYGNNGTFGMQDYGYAFSEPIELPEVKETSPPMATEENTIKPIDVNKNSCKNEFHIRPCSPIYTPSYIPYEPEIYSEGDMCSDFTITDDSSSSSNED